MESIYEHICICPICEKEFQTKKVREKNIRLLNRDTDFCKYYEGVNPYFYEINVCPMCGFSFSDTGPMRYGSKIIEKFVETFQGQWGGIDYTGERTINQAIDTYKLALICGNVVGQQMSAMAGICLRICWLYRMQGKKAEENRFIKGAIEFFEKAYEEEDFSKSGMDPETVVYLLGELNYRIEDYEQSKKWFNMGISKYGNSATAKKAIINSLRERWLEIKDTVLKNTE